MLYFLPASKSERLPLFPVKHHHRKLDTIVVNCSRRSREILDVNDLHLTTFRDDDRMQSVCQFAVDQRRKSVCALSRLSPYLISGTPCAARRRTNFVTDGYIFRFHALDQVELQNPRASPCWPQRSSSVPGICGLAMNKQLPNIQIPIRELINSRHGNDRVVRNAQCSL